MFFVGADGTSRQVNQLESGDGPGMRLGASISISDGVVVVGAVGCVGDSGVSCAASTGDVGRFVYVFKALDAASPGDSMWARVARLEPPSLASSMFGAAVSIHGGVAFVGAPANVGAWPSAGDVYAVPVTSDLGVCVGDCSNGLGDMTAAAALQVAGCVAPSNAAFATECPALVLSGTSADFEVTNDDLWGSDANGWQLRSPLTLLGRSTTVDRPSVRVSGLNARDKDVTLAHLRLTGSGASAAGACEPAWNTSVATDGGLLQLAPSAGASVRLRVWNCALACGQGRYGGAISASGGRVMIGRTRITDCTAASGGALHFTVR